MTLKYEAVVSKSLPIQIADQIQESIVQGHLKVDDRLPTEEELARRFSVSRPTIREALKRLGAKNLIRSKRGPTGGTFVNNPNTKEAGDNLATLSSLLVSLGKFDLTDIASARKELELICCRLACLHRKKEQLDRMSREIEAQKGSDLSDEDFCASDIRFHRALVDGSGNSVFKFLMYAVIESLQPIENMIIFRYRDRTLIVEQHEKLYEAILNQNEGAAEKVLLEQMEHRQNNFEQADLERKK